MKNTNSGSAETASFEPTKDLRWSYTKQSFLATERKLVLTATCILSWKLPQKRRSAMMNCSPARRLERMACRKENDKRAGREIAIRHGSASVDTVDGNTKNSILAIVGH